MKYFLLLIPFLLIGVFCAKDSPNKEVKSQILKIQGDVINFFTLNGSLPDGGDLSDIFKINSTSKVYTGFPEKVFSFMKTDPDKDLLFGIWVGEGYYIGGVTSSGRLIKMKYFQE